MRAPAIGALRTALVLETPLDTPDDTGGATRAYVTGPTLYASVRTLQGALAWRAGRQDQALTHEVILRAYDGLTGAMRLRLGVRILQIVAIEADDAAPAFLRLLCEEVTP